MTTKKRAKTGKNAGVVTYTTRQIPPRTQVLLAAISGGRCELCNRDLVRHHLTGTRGNFGQRAHIVGFSDGGPRADESLDGSIHGIDNLMWLCHACHKLVDEEESENYPGHVLRQHKDRHEKRIEWLTSIAPENKTTIIKLVTRIKDQLTEASNFDIARAVSPLYPDIDPVCIDLTNIYGDGNGFIETAVREIDVKIRRLFETGAPPTVSLPISVFAIAPIPVLVHLGHRLPNPVKVHPYQLHKDTLGWTWKETGTTATYSFRKIADAHDSDEVALMLSLSGTIHQERLPRDVRDGATIYEITLKDETPRRDFLQTRADLDAFRSTYRTALAAIQKAHPRRRPIQLIPAVPPPVAVLCGHDLLPKVYPPLYVYDDDEANSGFTLQLKVNEHE